jgi:hypothetical protein
MRFSKIVVLGGFVATLPLVFITPALAQESKKGAAKKAPEKTEKKPEKKAKKSDEPKESFDLDVRGTLGAPAKSGDFYEFQYVVMENRKPVKKKAWLKVDSGTSALADRSVGVESLKEGDPLKIFAKPMEMESGGKGITTGKTYRLQAARVAIAGKKIRVNEAYGDPKDKKFIWCDASVEKAGKAITVNYEGGSYAVSTDKGFALINRGDADVKKDVHKGSEVLVQATAIDEKPEGEKEDHPAFHAAQIIVMEKRALQWYEALIP